MPQGLYELTAQLASSEVGSDLSIVADNSKTGVDCSDAANAVNGSLLFRLKDNSDVRLGVISNRWFKADDFRLYYMKESYILRKPVEEKIAHYESIVRQASDRTAYDRTLTDVFQLFPKLQTKEEADSLQTVIFAALAELIQNVPAKDGQYDLTSLLLNPNFDSGRNSWSMNNVPTFSDNIAEVFNNTGTFTIKQVLKNMPTGWYTLTAKAFSRATDFETALSTYLTGTPRIKANLLFDSRTVKIYNIFDDSRFCNTSTGFEYYGKPDGSSIPNTMAKANQAFEFGHYNNLLRVEKTKEGNLEIGLSMTSALANNWLAFDDFHLYYGKAKDVNIDTLNVSNKTYANITSSRVLKAGKIEAICLPYAPNIEQFEAVYELAYVNREKAVLIPSREMKAGYTYFVKVAVDTPVIADDVEMSSVLPDSIPVHWNGVFQKGVYKRGVAMNAHILNTDGTALEFTTKKEVPAATPRFYLPLSMEADGTTIPLEILDDWMNMSFEAHIENFKVEEFILNNVYDRTSTSVVSSYNVAPTWRRDQPRAVMIPIPTLESSPRRVYVNYSLNSDMSDSISIKIGKESKQWYIYNLVPERQYFYQVIADDEIVSKGKFFTKGKVRMLRFNSGSNMRDMGGWTTTDGRKVKYGKIFRGGELHKGLETTLSNNDLTDFKAMGFAAELDLRNNDQVINNVAPTSSALGNNIPYIYLNQYMFTDDALQQDTAIYRKAFNFFADNLRKENVIYFHCIWGADRTGALAMLLNGLLGVGVDQLYKDYELTSFSKAGLREKVGLDSKLDYLEQYGGTLQEQIYRYLSEYVNVLSENLDFIIEQMLDGEPNSIREVIGNVHNQESKVYDLQGRLTNSPFKKGVYIKGGKKFIVR